MFFSSSTGTDRRVQELGGCQGMKDLIAEVNIITADLKKKYLFPVLMK